MGLDDGDDAAGDGFVTSCNARVAALAMKSFTLTLVECWSEHAIPNVRYVELHSRLLFWNYH